MWLHRIFIGSLLLQCAEIVTLLICFICESSMCHSVTVLRKYNTRSNTKYINEADAWRQASVAITTILWT